MKFLKTFYLILMAHPLLFNSMILIYLTIILLHQVAYVFSFVKFQKFILFFVSNFVIRSIYSYFAITCLDRNPAISLFMSYGRRTIIFSNIRRFHQESC